MEINEITIKSEEVGKEYIKELKEVLNIRIDRRKIWKDNFLNEIPEDTLVMIKGKLKRYENTDNFEAKIDSLRDLINYTLFLLIIINNKNDKNKKNM